MDQIEAKFFIESLIFSADEPLSKESMKKILDSYGKFDLDKIIIQLKDD